MQEIVDEFNKNIDKIFVINLEYRTDRLERISTVLNQMNLKFEVFNAVNGLMINENFVYDGEKIGEPYPGGWHHFKCQIGCFLSHYEILKICKDRGYERVLILEDDCEFCDNFIQRFNNVFKNIPLDWDFIYLSCSQPDFIENYDGFAKISFAYTTHSYVLNIKTINFLIHHLRPLVFKREIDVCYSDLHKNINSFTFLPFITFQGDGHSDIGGHWVEYPQIKKYL